MGRSRSILKGGDREIPETDLAVRIWCGQSDGVAELAVIYAGPRLSDSSGSGLEYQRNRSATPDIDEGNQRPKPSPTPSPRKP